MNKRFLFFALAAIVLIGGALAFRFAPVAPRALWNVSRGGTWLLPLVAVTALIDSINPCAFSILLITIGFLFSVGAARSRVLAIGGVYILGIYLVYLGIGLGILQTLHLFSTPHFMAKAGAILLILWGALNVIGQLVPSFPIRLAVPQAAHRKMAELMNAVSIPGAFALGGLVGLCEFPCTGGPYLMILGLLHDTTTHLQGVAYLVLYNIIFISPLVVILLIASERSLTERVRQWQRGESRLMRLGGGLVMIGLGLLIFLL